MTPDENSPLAKTQSRATLAGTDSERGLLAMWTNDANVIQIEPEPLQAIVPDDGLLTLQQVLAITQVTKRTIYREMKLKRFPLPIKVAGGSVRWLRHELIDYLMERVVERYAQKEALPDTHQQG